MSSTRDFDDEEIMFGPHKSLQYYCLHADMHALQVTPSKYDLFLKPDLKNFTFDGEVKIHVEVSEETKTVSLHAKEVNGFCTDVCQAGRLQF